MRVISLPLISRLLHFVRKITYNLLPILSMQKTEKLVAKTNLLQCKKPKKENYFFRDTHRAISINLGLQHSFINVVISCFLIIYGIMIVSPKKSFYHHDLNTKWFWTLCLDLMLFLLLCSVLSLPLVILSFWFYSCTISIRVNLWVNKILDTARSNPLSIQDFKSYTKMCLVQLN